MKSLDFGRYALCSCVAAAMLIGCGGSQPPIGVSGVMPQSSQPAQAGPRGPSWIEPGTSRVTPPRTPGDKLYVQVQSLTNPYNAVINGYRLRHGQLKKLCTFSGITQAGGVSADAQGHPLVPDSMAPTVTVFSGPGLCGNELGSLTDPYGQPVDASSINAATGIVAVANIFDSSSGPTLKPGSISVCTLSGGCKTNLTNPNMFELCCVLLAKNGDCWASALNHSITAGTLTYFRRCSGSGKAATGYKGPGYGSLDIDSQGNLVTVSWTNKQTDLYVYHGCNPRCSLIGGPLLLTKGGIRGHLNASGTTWAMANFMDSSVDVYAYTPTKVTYEYSFYIGNGMVAGLAFSPRSK
jgi:hypothetical protein